MSESDFQLEKCLKADELGRIELGTLGETRVIRRLAIGGLLGPIARMLLAREARALSMLMQANPKLEGVADLIHVCGRRELFRSWIEGQPLHLVQRLPANFFELLEDLLGELHRQGVAHNDLHKEPNILVTPEGRPALVDFQLASVHRLSSKGLRRRAAEDFRHIQKHAVRYANRDSKRRSKSNERGLVARVWMATGKPLYNWITRRLIQRSDSEGRRPRGGPWPEWDPPLARTTESPSARAASVKKF